MRQYIDRETVRRMVYSSRNNLQMQYMFEQIPVADVRENVRGKWIPITDIDEDRNQLFECDNCHHTDLHAVNVEVPFWWCC